MTQHLDPTVGALMGAVDSHAATMAEIDDDHLAAATHADAQLEAAAAATWASTPDTDTE